MVVGSRDAADVQLLIFRIDERDHALPVDNAVEVVRMVAATPLPEAPPWVVGVINFRGRVLALIDLRTRLRAPRREPDLSTPIIVMETNGVAAGLVVDEVVEVLALGADAIGPTDRVTAVTPAVSGVVRAGDRLILVLDPERLCEGPFDLRRPDDGGEDG